MTDNVFDQVPEARRVVESATGLSGEQIDRVMEGFAAVGLVSTLPPNADSASRYSHALHLVQTGVRSVHAAAHEAGLNPANFRRKLIAMNEKLPEAEKLHRAAEERILTMAEQLSESAGEKLLEKVDGDELKAVELQKVYTASTNQIAAKRRWNQGMDTGSGRTQDALANALADLRGKRITIEDADPADQALDITPRDEAGKTTGAV